MGFEDSRFGRSERSDDRSGFRSGDRSGFGERGSFGKRDSSNDRSGGFRGRDNDRSGFNKRDSSNDRSGGFRGRDNDRSGFNKRDSSNDRSGFSKRDSSNDRNGGRDNDRGGFGGRSQSRGRNGDDGDRKGSRFGGDDRKGGNACFKCNEVGHMSRDCPNQSGRGGGGRSDDRACFKCKETGHISKDCPNVEDDPNRPPASTYVPDEIQEDELYEHIDAGINFDKYDKIPVKVRGSNPPEEIKSFSDVIKHRDLLEVIKRSKYNRPTPIQKIAIPAIMDGRSMMSCAQTGSGKTAAFNLPIIHMMLDSDMRVSRGSTQEPIALVLAPTRELAIQTYKDALKWTADTPLKVNILYGGTSTSHQRDKLFSGTHMLIATPGRCVDFIEKGFLTLDRLKFIVLDEADRLVDAGFIPAVRDIITHPSVNKGKLQTLMFSATFPKDVQLLAEEFLPNDHLFLTVGVVGAANSDVKQTIIRMEQHDKKQQLLDILENQNGNERTIIFVKLKTQADYTAAALSLNKIPSTSIHSDRTQQQREQALKDFRTGKMALLVATAVAARGLDIKDITHVINYDMPDDIDEYVHRIGRTGRVGNTGKATSFYVSSNDYKLAADLCGILEESDQEVPEWLRREGGGARSSYGRHNLGSGRKDFGNRDRNRSPGFNDSRRSNGHDSRRNSGGYDNEVTNTVVDEDDSWT